MSTKNTKVDPGPPAPVGCICPPGANKDCARPDCPRKDPLQGYFGVKSL